MAENAQSDGPQRTPDADADVVDLRTGELDAPLGRAQWGDTIGQLYGEMDVAWPDPAREFDAQWDGRPLGDLHISAIRSDEQTVVRSPAMIASDGHEDYLVCLVVDGQVRVEQSQRVADLGVGSFALLDLNRPFVFESPGSFAQVAVRVPGDLLRSRLPAPYAMASLSRPFGAPTSPAAIVSRLLADLAGAPTLTAGTDAVFAQSVVDMLGSAILGDVRSFADITSFRAQDLERIRAVIADGLHDAELTPAVIAAHCDMSLRNVQKLLKTISTTPNVMLYRMRIDRAKTYLSGTSMSVAAISEAVGFRDVSHFSRVFSKQVGVSPGRFRDEGAD